MSRSIAYSSSPLLTSATPVWRSKFIVAGLALAFVGLAGRAAYVQVFGNEFFQRQGALFAQFFQVRAQCQWFAFSHYFDLCSWLCLIIKCNQSFL